MVIVRAGLPLARYLGGGLPMVPRSVAKSLFRTGGTAIGRPTGRFFCRGLHFLVAVVYTEGGELKALAA